jgi:hypothetical protein
MPADSYEGSMFSFARAAAEVKALTTSAFLIALQQHARQVSFFEPLVEHLRAKIKSNRYGRSRRRGPCVCRKPWY